MEYTAQNALLYGWYAQRRLTVRLERNPDFCRCAMLLNAQISGFLATA